MEMSVFPKDYSIMAMISGILVEEQFRCPPLKYICNCVFTRRPACWYRESKLKYAQPPI